MSDRDTCTYELKDGHELVYIGTTNDLERRKREHENSGKKFTRMNKTSNFMTEEGAMKKEKEDLARYRRNQGRYPRYNTDPNG